MKTRLTVGNIRKTNKLNILKSIIAQKEVMRSELASHNGISVMTVKKIVDELIEDGIVEESVCDTNVGRKPKSLYISDLVGVMVCISLSSKLFFSYIIYSVYGEILEERQRRIDEQYSYFDNLYYLNAQIQSDLKRLERSLIGLGISVPGAYYEKDDMVNYDLISELKGLKVKQTFEKAFGCKNVIVIHDVFGAAQAEYELMEQKDSSMFYFYVGDGVGGAFINRGQVLVGDDLVAGEVGQFVIFEENERFVTLEDRVSIPHITELFQKKHPNVNFYTMLQMYDRGEAAAVDIIDDAASLIAHSLYNVLWILNPQRIVISSSFNRFREIIIDKCREFNSRLTALPIRAMVDIFPSKLNAYGEMQGCFHLLLAQWVNEIACAPTRSFSDPAYREALRERPR
jgi:predicted NBD/HSP70 family sugar kinase